MRQTLKKLTIGYQVQEEKIPMPDSSNQRPNAPTAPSKPQAKPKTQPNFVERMADDKPFDWLKVDTTTAQQK